MNKDNVLSMISEVFTQVDSICDAHKGPNKLQFAALISKVVENLSFDARQAKEVDPIIRFYIRNHEKWCSVQGRTGGIELRNIKDNRAAAQAAKSTLKQQMKADIDNKVAATVDRAASDDELDVPSFPLDEGEDDDTSNNLLVEDEGDFLEE